MKSEITIATKNALREIQDITFYNDNDLNEYCYERLGSIISSCIFEQENILKKIQKEIGCE